MPPDQHLEGQVAGLAGRFPDPRQQLAVGHRADRPLAARGIEPAERLTLPSNRHRIGPLALGSLASVLIEAGSDPAVPAFSGNRVVVAPDMASQRRITTGKRTWLTSGMTGTSL